LNIFIELLFEIYTGTKSGFVICFMQRLSRQKSKEVQV